VKLKEVRILGNKHNEIQFSECFSLQKFSATLNILHSKTK